MFGIFSAIGVVVSFLILVTLMPAALELFPPRLVPVEPITLDLAHEGAVGDIRNFEIRTPP